MLITLIFDECIDMRCKHADMPYCDSHIICIIDKQLEGSNHGGNLAYGLSRQLDLKIVLKKAILSRPLQ